VSAGTAGWLLKQMDFSLRVNVKRIESGIKNPPSRRNRSRQLLYIAQQRERMDQAENPVVSVNSERRELISSKILAVAVCKSRSRSMTTIFSPMPWDCAAL